MQKNNQINNDFTSPKITTPPPPPKKTLALEIQAKLIKVVRNFFS